MQPRNYTAQNCINRENVKHNMQQAFFVFRALLKALYI